MGPATSPTPSTTFGETASYPGLTPPHLLLLTWKTEGSSRAGPLPWASPHLWLRRYGFRSQTFLEFSTFLIFPKSKEWKLETNVLVSSGYCSPQPWQSILPSIMWTEATSWCLEVYSEYTIINRHRRLQLTLWGISKWLTLKPQPFPETQFHCLKMHLCPHLGTLLPGLCGPCRERSFRVNSPQLSLTQLPTRSQAAAGSGRSSVKAQGLRAGQETPTSAVLQQHRWETAPPTVALLSYSRPQVRVGALSDHYSGQ